MVGVGKVPVVLQLSAADCGAACLAMVLRYWGRHVSTQQCQVAMGGGQDGATALMIARAARDLGLTAEAFRHTPQGVAQAALPAIVHWQGVHFVVLERWEASTVTIVDPALGRRRLTLQEFADGYSGVTLVLQPGPQFKAMAQEAAQTGSAFTGKALLRQIWAVPGVPSLLGRLLGISLLLQLAGLILPAATWLAVEVLLPSVTSASLALLGGGLMVAMLAQGSIAYLRALAAIRLQQRLDGNLIPTFFTHLLRLPYAFFQQRTTGDLIARLEGHTALRELLTTGILTGLLDGGLALFYLIVLYVQAPSFGMVVTAVALAQLLVLVRTGERVHELSRMELALRAEETSFATQTLRGIESVKAAGAEPWIGRQWRARFDATLQASYMRDLVVARLDTLLVVLSNATPLALLWIGVGAVAAGTLSLGQMLALVVLASSTLTPLGNLALWVNRGQQIWAHLERLGDVLETQPEHDTSAVVVAAKPEVPMPSSAEDPLTGAIQIENLSFGYSQEGTFALRDISLAVAPGEQVAIVGPTGAGKSTLVRLLFGIYRPQQGVIRYDGRTIDELGLTRLRREIGAVLQDAFILGGSVRENIALHQPDMSLAQIMEAARLASLHAEIMRLPMGYETRVGEGGNGLSGGQRQRLALARALAPRPRILILDEASSHLDLDTEATIRRALDELQATRIVVAHRPDSVRNADRVLMLSEGHLVPCQGFPAPG